MILKEAVLKTYGKIGVLFLCSLKVSKNKVPHLFYICFTLITLPISGLRAQTISLLHHNISSSIRGLSVVDDRVGWVSGSKGTIGITVDGGKTWAWQQVKGFEQTDFRDIEAFSQKEAVIMSSGTPAVILKTIDGGINWLVSYQKNDKAFFFDAMEFHGHNYGMTLGDPINGKFLILETFNSGKSWTPAKNPPSALPNEAAFAASGTCLRNFNSSFIMVTGGSDARMITLTKSFIGHSRSGNIPILHGKASQGAFSIAFGHKQVIIVGGDYSNASRNDSVAVFMHGTSMQLSTQQPAGYQSCVENIKENSYVSTGTSGSNLTTDGGKTWHQIDTVSYNVCRKAKHGNLILLAGDDGKIGIYKP